MKNPEVTQEILKEVENLEKEQTILNQAETQLNTQTNLRFKVIKGKFKSQKIIAYGAFIALFDSELNTLSKFNLQVALRPHFLDDFDKDTPWYVYDSKLIAYSLKLKELNQGVTNGLRQVLKVTFDDKEFIKTIIKHFSENTFEALTNTIREKILDVISDTAMITEFYYESVDDIKVPDEFGGKAKSDIKENEFDYSEEDRNRIFVQMDIIHAPVDGTQLKDLDKSKRVYAKNLIKEEIDKYNLQKTSSYKNNNYCPLFAGLRRIPETDTTGEWEALFNFGDGKYGKVKVYPIVKVKVFEEEDVLVEKALQEAGNAALDIKESLKIYFIFLSILLLFGIIIWWYYNYGILYSVK